LELAQMYEQLSPAQRLNSIPLYERGLELAQESPGMFAARRLLDMRFKLGQLLMSNKQFAEAARVLLELARTDHGTNYPQALGTAVEAYSRMVSAAEPQQYEALVKSLEEVIALDPTNERAYALLGRIYFQQGDWAKARGALLQAVQRAPAGTPGPGTADSLYYLGVSQRRLGEIASAAATLQQLMGISTSNYDALCELAEIRTEQSAYAGAINLFERAMTNDRSKYRAFLGRGMALKKLSRFEEARADLRAVIERDPTNARAALAVAETYYEEKLMPETDEACQNAVRIVQESNPDELTDENKRILAQTYTLLGLATLNQAKPNLARDTFDKALASVADYAPALDGIGKTYQAEGNQERALDYIQRAIAADPGNPDYYLSLGIQYHNFNKDLTKALVNYLKYLELGGKDPKVRKWIQECGGTPPDVRVEPPAADANLIRI
jgi:tetratricopeptide (TPR) repeat protein